MESPPPPPSPAEIYDRAVAEGERRLDQPAGEVIATSFIAGFTIVFGVVALGIVEAVVRPEFGRLATIAGALAFGPGVVFLVVGRTELFNENFSDPAAAAIERSDAPVVAPLLRLWSLTLVFNLVGGCGFALVFAVEGALPAGAGEALAHFATETLDRGAQSWFARGIAGGALLGLMSFLLVSVDADGSRIAIAYVVGVLLALGTFDHVVVTVVHAFIGVLHGASVAPGRFLAMTVVVTAGNLVGGLGLVTLAHVAQAHRSRDYGQRRKQDGER